ncbi:MAG: TetR/AcrR family transcriptional regulator [Verrucomicrobiota bacterium]
MPTTTLTRSQQKRAAIVDAAMEEFKASGFHATSMDTIAARAKVSKRTVYNHFESKDSLFTEISQASCDAVMDMMEIEFDPGRPVDEQLAEFAAAMIDLCCSEKFMTMAQVTLPERVRNPGLANPGFDRIRRGENGMARWLEQAIDAGVLDVVDAAVASRQFIALILEFALWPQLIGGEKLPDAAQRRNIIASAVNLFLNGSRK